MSRFALLALTIFAATLLAPQAEACWAAPPAVVWGEDSGGADFVYKRNNESGEITIYAKDDRETPLWSATLEGFSSLFSQVYLVADGTKLVHVRSNHQVGKLTDTAVSVYTRSGSTHHAAKHFVDAIARKGADEPRMSTDPGGYWLATVKSVSATQLVVVTHDQKAHTLAI